MKITKAVFAGSSTNINNKPKQKLPEFAFIGRSNVGKSSLINMLCGGAQKLDGTKERKVVLKELAKTSSSPGKTVLVNHFMIDGSWYLVDLPGYGFAKIPKPQRDALAKMNNELH
jgi:GTP-binding protein